MRVTVSGSRRTQPYIV